MSEIRVPVSGGSIAVEVCGEGPLVVLIPGMGETRASFRHVIDPLRAQGYRVAAMDLRGHGATDASFEAFDDAAAASDALAVIDALGGGPAVLVGNSMGAAAAVLAAADRPDSVAGLVLIGPFVRDHGGAFSRLAMRLALAGPWGRAVWSGYYRSLFGDRRPEDHDTHVMGTLARLRSGERWRAFRLTAQTSHAQAEQALAGVTQPVLIVMGSADPDFRDPAAEAGWIADAVGAEVAMVEGAGHYPMGEQPQAVLDPVLGFLGRVAASRAAVEGRENG